MFQLNMQNCALTVTYTQVNKYTRCAGMKLQTQQLFAAKSHEHVCNLKQNYKIFGIIFQPKIRIYIMNKQTFVTLKNCLYMSVF